MPRRCASPPRSSSAPPWDDVGTLTMTKLFDQELQVVNVGLSAFAECVRANGAPVVAVDWQPPAGGDAKAGMTLAKLINDPKIDAANAKAFELLTSSRPVLEGVKIAGDVLPRMAPRMILHAGPPIAWDNMCGPMKGAIVGAVLFEGWAESRKDALALAASGEIPYGPCHHCNAVGPMAGIISPSMPVWVVRNDAQGNRAYSNLNEGLGKVLRFGAHDPETIDRLRWMADSLAPALNTALAHIGGVEIKPLMAQALHMGDELHNRNTAASGLLLKRLLPGLLCEKVAREDATAVSEFIAGNDHFFLNLSMAACKVMLDAAHGVADSSLVTAMARNGVEFGIRTSGTRGRWFKAPAPMVDGLLFPGYDISDCALDLGDSAIAETAGLGGFAMAAAPAIVQFVGGSPAEAVANTRVMAAITQGPNTAFTLPALGFAGTPSGIDTRKVVDCRLEPIINTGIAHRKAGVGQVGAGITHAPMACFVKAVSALADIRAS